MPSKIFRIKETPEIRTFEVDTESPFENPFQSNYDNAAQNQNENPIEIPVEILIEIPAEIPSENPSEIPSEIPIEIPIEIPVEVPIETPQQISRRLQIAKDRAKSERMRLIGVANRVAKAASLPSPPSAATSRPAHALPVNVRSDMFDSLREEDMPQESVPAQGSVPARCTSCGSCCPDQGHGTTVFTAPLIDSNFVNSSAVATASEQRVHLFEAFCDDNSSIGKIAPKYGINVCRFSLNSFNLGTKTGTKLALTKIRANAGAHLHSSLPCTVWSTWNTLNCHKFGKAFSDKLESRRAQSLVMLNNFFLLAREIIALGGDVSFEWPRFCTGWKIEALDKFIQKFKLQTVDFDGCSLGPKSKKGNAIKKPWRIVTTSSSLVAKLKPFVCCNSRSDCKHHVHDICQGAETYKTGFYIEHLSIQIITGLIPKNIVIPSRPIAVAPSYCKEPVVNSVSPVPLNRTRRCSGEPTADITCSGGTLEKIVTHATQQIEKSVSRASAKIETLLKNTEFLRDYNVKVQKSFLVDDKTVEKQLLCNQIEQIQKEMKHREKVDLLPINFMGLVTKILSKNDSEYHSAGAKAAIDTEITKLVTAGVWDVKPVPKRWAEDKYKDASFSRIFGILGIKDVESSTSKFKYRVVLQGSNVKDAGHNNVYFADTSSAPTNMTCIRSVLAYGHLSGGETSQADAEQAFIQPLLDESDHMFIFVPPEMQTIEMKNNCIGVSNPVFRLRRPLYGWSRSGNIWESHLSNT